MGPTSGVINYELLAGCRMGIEDWLELNWDKVFHDQSLTQFVSPFPPPELMEIVGGLQREGFCRTQC